MEGERGASQTTPNSSEVGVTAKTQGDEVNGGGSRLAKGAGRIQDDMGWLRAWQKTWGGSRDGRLREGGRGGAQTKPPIPEEGVEVAGWGPRRGSEKPPKLLQKTLG